MTDGGRSAARRGARGVALAAALVAAAATGCEGIGAPARVQAPADRAAGEIPFRLAGPGGAALVVPVHVNGRGPYDLILDTGATITCVDDSLARELALPEQRGVIGTGVGVGGAGRVQLVRVDSLRVGGASAERLSACTLDLQGLRRFQVPARGLLGLNFLREFDVALDFRRGVLTLTAPGTGGARTRAAADSAERTR